MSKAVTHVLLKKWNDSGLADTPDLVAVEEPLEIRLGFGATHREQKSLSVTMRTPGHDFELVAGFLFTEGIVRSVADIESMKYCVDRGKVGENENIVRVELKPRVELDWAKLQRNFYTSSSCGVCGKSSIESVRTLCAALPSASLEISLESVLTLPEEIRKSQRVFEYTGGLHGAGVFNSKGQLLILREDVGRHNALDKVIGALAWKNELPAHECGVMVSGRASFELVQKTAMAGFSMLAAVGAPSSLAVSLAKETGITLVGFLRGNTFNIYTGESRIRV